MSNRVVQCWREVDSSNTQELDWSIDMDSLRVMIRHVDGSCIHVCLRGVLHDASAIHAVTHPVTSSSSTPPAVYRVSKEGKFSGIEKLLKSGKYTSVNEALKDHAADLVEKKEKKRRLNEAEAGEAAAQEEDVVFVQEKTRAQRDEEGKANALVLE